MNIIVMVSDELLFILIALIGSYLLILMGMRSSGQTIRFQSVTDISFGTFDTNDRLAFSVLVDGWHIKTVHTITSVIAVVGGPVFVNNLATPKNTPSSVANNTDQYLEMATIADNSGSGGIVSAQAAVMPSGVFYDPDMALGTTFVIKKCLKVQVNRQDDMEISANINKLGGTITAGRFLIKTTVWILIGNVFDRKERRDAQGCDVNIHIVDQTALKFGGWLPFCNGRIGSIRVQAYATVVNTESVFLFGSGAIQGETVADEDGEITVNADGPTLVLPLAQQNEEAGFVYVTNFVKGPWFYKGGEQIPWACDMSEATETRFVISFKFIPDSKANVRIPYSFKNIEIGTPDLEEFRILPFDMYIESVQTTISVVGTVVGIILWQVHLFKDDTQFTVAYTSSEVVLDGSLLGAHTTTTGVDAASLVDQLRIPVELHETASGVFTGSGTKESIAEVFDYFVQGSALGVLAIAVDATTVSHLEGSTIIRGKARVKSNNFGADYILGEQILNFEGRAQ